VRGKSIDLGKPRNPRTLRAFPSFPRSIPGKLPHPALSKLTTTFIRSYLATEAPASA